MQVFDEDSVRDIKAEEQAYETWLRTEKNRVLNMSDSRRKQEAWKQLFPQMVCSDDWLLGAKVW